jgi:hypothetical protein
MWKCCWLSIPYTLLYIIAIFIGRIWIKKFELRKSLVIWNTILTIFSFWVACRCVAKFIHSLINHDFLYSVCDPNYKQGIIGLW